MKKSIEERANKFALEKHPYSPFCEEYAKMYIEIATEQKAIDDEEQGKALLYAVAKTEERTKKEMIDKACEWLSERCAFRVHPCSGTALVMEFRKAMEE